MKTKNNIIYCPSCCEKLNKIDSIDIFIEKFSCKNNHRFYVPIQEVNASKSEKVHGISLKSTQNDEDSILKWLSENKYRKFLNDQLALLLRRIYEIKKNGNNITDDGLSQFIYCPLCKDKLLQFKQVDIWVIGLRCNNNHNFLYRNGVRDDNFKLCDEPSNKTLLFLIKTWLKKNSILESNINEQILNILKRYKSCIIDSK